MESLMPLELVLDLEGGFGLSFSLVIFLYSWNPFRASGISIYTFNVSPSHIKLKMSN